MTYFLAIKEKPAINVLITQAGDEANENHYTLLQNAMSIAKCNLSRLIPKLSAKFKRRISHGSAWLSNSLERVLQSEAWVIARRCSGERYDLVSLAKVDPSYRLIDPQLQPYSSIRLMWGSTTLGFSS